jgi:Uma2 family endonuclease
MAQPHTYDRPLSIEEYLELEETSAYRHEYLAGEIYAMTGATRRHNRIIVNIAAHLWAAARGGPCRVYVESVKLRAAIDTIYYPDLMVACGPEGESPWIEDAPCLVVEVTSPSTETIDRREKMLAYRRMNSLEAYVIVDQERRRVERHYRNPDRSWGVAQLVDRGPVPIPCPAVELTLDDIYEGVEPAAGG